MTVYSDSEPDNHQTSSARTRRSPATWLMIALLAALCCAAFSVGTVTAAPTTALNITVFAPDGVTVVNQTTLTYQWMEQHLPVMGDGTTHYYHQGPVFSGDKWDPNETVNYKDRGAVKGTAIRDLCALMGGISPGDDVMIAAVDGYHVQYGYETIENPQPRLGPLVITWYNGENPAVGEKEGVGYVPDYYNGMRLVFMADASTNPQGLHVFGNADMKEALPEDAQYFYNDQLPSTSGVSVKWISELRIYQGGFKGDRSAPVKSLSNATAVPTTQKSPVPWVTAPVGLLLVLLLWRR